MTVILGTASGAQNVGPLSAIAVGGYIALAGLWASPISGASMNPDRSFGPDLVMGNFSHFWVTWSDRCWGLWWQWGQLTFCGAEGEARSLCAPPRGP